jgi:hypothetical protein
MTRIIKLKTLLEQLGPAEPEDTATQPVAPPVNNNQKTQTTPKPKPQITPKPQNTNKTQTKNNTTPAETEQPLLGLGPIPDWAVYVMSTLVLGLVGTYIYRRVTRTSRIANKTAANLEKRLALHNIGAAGSGDALQNLIQDVESNPANAKLFKSWMHRAILRQDANPSALLAILNKNRYLTDDEVNLFRTVLADASVVKQFRKELQTAAVEAFKNGKIKNKATVISYFNLTPEAKLAFEKKLDNLYKSTNYPNAAKAAQTKQAGIKTRSASGGVSSAGVSKAGLYAVETLSDIAAADLAAWKKTSAGKKWTPVVRGENVSSLRKLNLQDIPGLNNDAKFGTFKSKAGNRAWGDLFPYKFLNKKGWIEEQWARYQTLLKSYNMPKTIIDNSTFPKFQDWLYIMRSNKMMRTIATDYNALHEKYREMNFIWTLLK